MASDFLKCLAIVSAIVFIGLVLIRLGILHEHIITLRDEKAEVKVFNANLEKKIEELEKQLKHLKEQKSELEKELMKYDKKRKRDARKQSDN